MKNLAVRIGLGVLGLGLMLGYWTYFHKTSPSTATSHMPDKVFGGGGDKLAIDLEVANKAKVSLLLEPPSSEGNQPIQEYYQELDAGHHSFTVELAPKTTGTVELHALAPPVGNTISWTVSRNGRQIAQESHTLEKPLQSGEAQFLQVQLTSEQQPSDEGSE